MNSYQCHLKTHPITPLLLFKLYFLRNEEKKYMYSLNLNHELETLRFFISIT